MQQALEPQEYARIVVDLITDLKGEDIVLMDLREITIITDFFVICTASSDRQSKAIMEKITEDMKKDYGLPKPQIEGKPFGGWILIDYGDWVVHVFSEEQREYYDLEGLWKEARVLLRIQ